MDAPARVTVAMPDPALDDVQAQDRPLVRDVISVLHAMQNPLKVCKGWTVTLVGVNYEVTGSIDTRTGEWEVFYEDLDLLRQLDYARVGPVSIRGIASSVSVRVRVTAKSVPVMITQTDILRVQKRTRWFGA